MATCAGPDVPDMRRDSASSSSRQVADRAAEQSADRAGKRTCDKRSGAIVIGGKTGIFNLGPHIIVFHESPQRTTLSYGPSEGTRVPFLWTTVRRPTWKLT